MSMPALPNEVIACAAWLFDTTARDILRPSKHRIHVVPRWAAIKALRFHGRGYCNLARLFNKDRTTIMHAIQQADRLMAEDYAFADKVATLVALRDGEFLAQKRMGACKQHIPVLRKPVPKTVKLWKGGAAWK